MLPAPLLRMAPSGTTKLCYHPAGENGHTIAYYRLFLTALRGYADGPKPIWKYAPSPCLKEGYVETEAFSSVPQLEACLWYPILKKWQLMLLSEASRPNISDRTCAGSGASDLCRGWGCWPGCWPVGE